MVLDLSSLAKSIVALEKSVQVLTTSDQMKLLSLDAQETIKSGVIQNFEVAYEQSWKMMKRWLETNVGSTQIDGVSRRELFRVAAESLLIKNVDQWMDFHRARNETSHSYDGTIAQDVIDVALVFVSEAQTLLRNLENHND